MLPQFFTGQKVSVQLSHNRLPRRQLLPVSHTTSSHTIPIASQAVTLITTSRAPFRIPSSLLHCSHVLSQPFTPTQRQPMISPNHIILPHNQEREWHDGYTSGYPTQSRLILESIARFARLLHFLQVKKLVFREKLSFTMGKAKNVSLTPTTCILVINHASPSSSMITTFDRPHRMRQGSG